MLKTLIILAVVFYAIAVAVMYFAQRRFIYFPDPTRTIPRAAGLANVVERIIATPDGEKIVAWYGKAAVGQPTLLYFHGNGGALELRAGRIARYLDRGRGIFMMSYRGYSGSTGSPSEAKNIADAKLAYEALVADGVSPDDIILYGELLGTGVAIEVAAEKKVAGVILDSPFTSIVERAAQLYPWLPVRLLLQDRYELSNASVTFTRHSSSFMAKPTTSCLSRWDDSCMRLPMSRRRSRRYPALGTPITMTSGRSKLSIAGSTGFEPHVETPVVILGRAGQWRVEGRGSSARVAEGASVSLHRNMTLREIAKQKARDVSQAF